MNKLETKDEFIVKNENKEFQLNPAFKMCPESLEALSQVKEMPMFASMNRYLLAEATYEEWLRSLPYDLLEEYSEHTMRRKTSTEREWIIDQDYLGTVITLHALETNNSPITSSEIAKKMGAFQQLLCALSINKTVAIKIGVPDAIVDIKFGTWKDFLDVHLRANPNVKFVDKSEKNKEKKKESAQS